MILREDRRKCPNSHAKKLRSTIQCGTSTYSNNFLRGTSFGIRCVISRNMPIAKRCKRGAHVYLVLWLIYRGANENLLRSVIGYFYNKHISKRPTDSLLGLFFLGKEKLVNFSFTGCRVY